MSLESQEAQIRKSREASAERARESRESKEGKEMDEAAKAAATMERADFLVKEVKSGKQQIQNIVIHMQQVLSAIQALRQQLQLKNDDAVSSVSQDKKQVEKIKRKIAEHRDEIIKMKDELILAQVEQLREGKAVGTSDEFLKKQAEEMIDRIMREVEGA
ncbi:MAG: hypothetical protein HYV41_04830 [Candidatus Magasanikbacteria bacterium]|nr:hypothetical protein [Candidatus Magasanikbacteria bacterium]